MNHSTTKSVFFILLGITFILFCLSLLWVPRISLPEAPCIPATESRHNTTSEANTLPHSLLHRKVTRQLVDGLLPLDTKDKSSWSIFPKDSPEYPCSQYKTRFGNYMPRVWLVSHPRSGNTWTRYLLEAASGIFTGSVYFDDIIFNDGYLGEKDHYRSQRTLVQKTHAHTLWIISKKDSLLMRFKHGTTYIPTVLLLRNPAKAILSYYKYVKNRRHASEVEESEFKTKEFHTFVEDQARRWTELALDRLLWTEAPLHVMHYEHLRADPIKEITALLDFLGVPKHEGRLACLSLHLEGKFKSEQSKPLDPYKLEEKVMMMAGTKAVNRTLQLLGYPPLPSYPDWPMTRPTSSPGNETVL